MVIDDWAAQCDGRLCYNKVVSRQAVSKEETAMLLETRRGEDCSGLPFA
jgi:hypothetical protein